MKDALVRLRVLQPPRDGGVGEEVVEARGGRGPLPKVAAPAHFRGLPDGERLEPVGPVVVAAEDCIYLLINLFIYLYVGGGHGSV